MNLSKLTRRSAFRIAMLFAGLFSLAISVIFTVLYFSITSQLNQHLKAHVNEVRRTLIDVDENGGFDALAKMVNRHAAVAQSEEDIYLLTDDADQYIAGNIKPIPRFDGWKTLRWETLPLIGDWSAPRTSDAVVGRWTKVKDGHLLVADGNDDINQTQDALLDGLGWGVLMAAASATIGAVLLGLSAQSRVGTMETALNAVSRGDLDTRVPRSASGDDLDYVASVINTTLERLQDLIGSLKQVSTDIAHDLKTPIGRVRQRLELVQQPDSTVEAYRVTVDDTLADINRIVETFEALLRIAEIEGGARKARFVELDLKFVLSNVFDALEPVAQDAGHRIECSLPTATATTVSGDRELLSQMFANVIENSINHCPSGSSVTISMRSLGGQPTVIIADNGPGIPWSEHDKVFRRLYRLEKSRTTPGSGLGLSLVAAIADLHGATLTLSDNRPGLVTKIAF